MAERLKLPKSGRTPEFFADYTIFDRGSHLEVNEGWIQAEGRGNEIMSEIINTFQEIATSRQKPLVHLYEASTLNGKRLIKRYPEYQWVGRSSDRNSIYERTYYP